MSPLKQSKNIAARMGRWSASHWKTATFGWLAFVIASFAVGIAVPMQMIEKKDAAVGEAGKANKILDEAFDLDKNGQGELVIIQSKTKTVDDPAFRATINDTIDALSGFEQVEQAALAARCRATRVRSRPTATRSLITFSPHGTYDEAVALHRLDRRRHGEASRRPIRTSTSPRPASRPRRRSTRSSTAGSRRSG